MYDVSLHSFYRVSSRTWKCRQKVIHCLHSSSYHVPCYFTHEALDLCSILFGNRLRMKSRPFAEFLDSLVISSIQRFQKVEILQGLRSFNHRYKERDTDATSLL